MERVENSTKNSKHSKNLIRSLKISPKNSMEWTENSPKNSISNSILSQLQLATLQRKADNRGYWEFRRSDGRNSFEFAAPDRST